MQWPKKLLINRCALISNFPPSKVTWQPSPFLSNSMEHLIHPLLTTGKKKSCWLITTLCGGFEIFRLERSREGAEPILRFSHSLIKTAVNELVRVASGYFFRIKDYEDLLWMLWILWEMDDVSKKRKKKKKRCCWSISTSSMLFAAYGFSSGADASLFFFFFFSFVSFSSEYISHTHTHTHTHRGIDYLLPSSSFLRSSAHFAF